MKSIIVLLLLCFGTLFSQAKKSAQVYKLTEDFYPDGKLSMQHWKGTQVYSDFIQQEPNSGGIPRQKTSFRLAYSDEFLYLGVMCYDSAPDSIIAREMKWDGKLSGDDNLMIIFDTFNDDRNAYWFGTNALGMKDDAMLTGFDFSGFNETWNGIWDVASVVTDSGWSTEIRIPFSTLKFAESHEQVWGFNIVRDLRRSGELFIWTAEGKDKGLFKISEAGDLTGLTGLQRGDPIYVKPFITAGEEHTSERRAITKAGIDVKYGITNALSLDVTVNTDFAQVESDRARINLTRFPLYFPEKRDFFLEGANIFNYQVGGGNHIFYSRKIGLSAGEEIPLYGGIKLVGKEKDFDLGILAVQSKQTEKLPSTNYSAARLKYDLFQQSYIGFIFTGVENNKEYNRTAGIDFEYATNKFAGNKNLKVGGGLVSQFETNVSQPHYAGKLYIDYPNDLFDGFLGYRYIDEKFNPGLGLFPRTGLHSFGFNFDYTPRIDMYGIRKLNFTPVGIETKHSLNGTLLTSDYWISPFGFSTNTGDKLTLYIGKHLDRVETAFTIFNNKLITPGNYTSSSAELLLNSSTGRPLYGTIELYTAGFYSGTTQRLSAEGVLRINRHISLVADYQINEISLNNESFRTVETGGAIKYDFSTSLNSSLLGQWNNETKELLFNYRIMWQPKAGSAVYLVINQLLNTENTIQSRALTILAKAVWLFTFSAK